MNRSLRTAVSALLLSLCGCAVVRPPEGGPEDKTPPTVAVVDGSYTETDFRRRSIDVEFSEAVERSRVQECVSLSPEKPLSFSWSGRTLTVRFDEDLDTATTYALTIGTQYADLRGNTPTSATTVVFSTGSTLDKGKIAGTVQDEKPNGLLVYLYPLRGDTSQMSWGGTKPRYKTQVGTDGSFRFSALPDGSYRLIVVRDVDNDGVFTYGTDALGTAVADPVIASGSTVTCLLRLSPPADITPPELLDIRPRSSTRIDLQWSEPLKPGSVSLSTFILSDTSGANARAIRAVYPQSPGSTTWTCITEAVSSDLPLLLRPAHAGVTPQDTAGNRMPDSTAQMVFTPSTIADPLQPRLGSVSLRDSITTSDCTPELVFTWNMAIDPDSAMPGLRVECTTGSRAVPLRITRPAANRVVVSARDTLPFDTWFEWTMKTRGLLSAGGGPVADTSIRLRLRTPDTRLFGTLRGVVIDSANSHEVIVIRLLRGAQEVRRLVGQAGPFAFTALPPGEYSVDAFADRNGDGRYTSGSVHPWSAAERFAPLRSNLGIKPRWSLDDVRLVIPAP